MKLSFHRHAVSLLLLFGLMRCPALFAQAPVYPVYTQLATPAIPASWTNDGLQFDITLIGDLNGNGQPDIAYTTFDTSSGQSSLNVTLDFAGSTPTATSMPVCPADMPTGYNGYPVSVLGGLADFNKDGKLDAVVVCGGFKSIAVLAGNGDGTFQTPVYYATPPGTDIYGDSQTVVGDFNGDGYPDVVSVSYGSPDSFVSVLLSKGSSAPGVFNAMQKTSGHGLQLLSLYPGDVQVGDVNGDGALDLIVNSTAFLGGGASSYLAGSFSILYGNNQGAFPSKVVQAIPSAEPHFTVADFNHDGFSDVAAATSTGIQVYLGNASQQLTLGPQTTLSNGGIPPSITTADIAGDGTVWLVAEFASQLTLFRGDGKGGFVQGKSYEEYDASPKFADVNGDGKLDLIQSDLVTGLQIRTGNGDGTFAGNASTLAYGVPADVNGDGLTDIVYPAANGTTFSVASMVSKGDGTWNAVAPSPSQPITFGNRILLATGDFNGDGKVDAAVILKRELPSGGKSIGGAEIAVSLGNGDGTFQAPLPYRHLIRDSATTAAVGDFDGDGKLDVLIAYYEDEASSPAPVYIHFLHGNGDGTFAQQVLLAALPAQSYLPDPVLLVGDLNHDGKLDFICRTLYGGMVFMGRGDGTFAHIALPIDAYGGGLFSALGDVNGDGYPDLVTQTGIYAGNGDGTFSAAPLYQLSAGLSSLHAAIGDVNGDGNPDVVETVMNTTVGSINTESVQVLLGDGKGNFTPQSALYQLSSSAIYDYDNPQSDAFDAAHLYLGRLNNQAPATDNQLDLLVSLPTGPTASMLNQNNPQPTPVP